MIKQREEDPDPDDASDLVGEIIEQTLRTTPAKRDYAGKGDCGGMREKYRIDKRERPSFGDHGENEGTNCGGDGLAMGMSAAEPG
ncbi:uncharacterized protein SPSK_04713 [Sporothrix schenckii 1099-18]|uniref:Uncharacterized protein n=1 Tax=Sporothrix schenckii 1099-18 TaxID=1397361 RepID=A0A0F2M1F0_SPOSC|nr:uncharacterized protein SPSK_04713 [Sporothrix schenckii 1099-18]KJR83532.1 hypothetical protein SPSK_04713 [Sporothrix schenckii 1099-18]